MYRLLIAFLAVTAVTLSVESSDVCDNVDSELKHQISAYTDAVNSHKRGHIYQFFSRSSAYMTKHRRDNEESLIGELLRLDYLKLSVDQITCGDDSVVEPGCARVTGKLKAKFSAEEQETDGSYEHVWCKQHKDWKIELIVAKCENNGHLC